MKTTADDESEITGEELAEAQARWADPKHEPAAPDIFSSPVYGDGFRGDVPIESNKEEPTEPAEPFRGRRFSEGWSEYLRDV